ncbi:MAG: iron ABC transporter permease, partial [Dehalococcoidia bacterium]|nr:iron ABC transporter permease [Dehalococcoidia bacterium]
MTAIGAGAASTATVLARRGLVVRLALWVGGLAVVLFAAVVVATATGPARIPVESSAAALLRRVGLQVGEVTPVQQRIIEQIRLPRIIVAALVGAALAASGAALQAVFRNPLADPGIIGVSGGAAFGAVIAIGLRWGVVGSPTFFTVPVAAMVGALTATAAVTLLASAGGRLQPASLVLAGLAIQSFTGAGTSTVITMTGDNDLIRNMVFWLLGGFDGRSWSHVQVAAPIIGVGLVALVAFGRDLNVLAQGDETAHSLGLSVGLTRLIVLGLAAVITATGVAVSGPIAFVGLVAPHVFRLLAGVDYRLLLPVSALGGATLLVVADTIARTALQPAELRTGVVTALIGGPFFLYLIW